MFEGINKYRWFNNNLREKSTARFLLFILILMMILLQGCAVSYIVRVNGYIDPSKPLDIEPGAKIHIVEDTKAKNPLLEKEVIFKLDNMLRLKGYQVTEPDNARYYMLYGYGIGHERTITSTMPVYTPGRTATVTKTSPTGTSYSTIQIPSSTTYIPYATTVTDKWLFLKLVEGEDYRREGKISPVWIGEASITGEGSNIRELINYLIVGIYNFFGINTKKTISVDVLEDDPLVKRIINR
ncbi:MAG: hypothetical protein N3D15_02705 [Syntrophorhabdaceae bacterium]|nr:hypothetical protein [Syntrophorhabdaceae bacterium]